MPDLLKRCVLLIIAAVAAVSFCRAQPRSLGTSYSFSGIGLAYEHSLGDEAFVNVGLKAEMGEVFIGRTSSPGISVSFSYNFIFKEWLSRNGNSLSVYAGPGATVGISDDFRKKRGCFVGLKGRVGVECRFERNVIISLSLNPILGSHMVMQDGHVKMTEYRYGFLEAVLPEIGIRYMF